MTTLLGTYWNILYSWSLIDPAEVDADGALTYAWRTKLVELTGKMDRLCHDECTGNFTRRLRKNADLLAMQLSLYRGVVKLTDRTTDPWSPGESIKRIGIAFPDDAPDNLVENSIRYWLSLQKDGYAAILEFHDNQG